MKTWVCGHRNPDVDSVMSAYALADLRARLAWLHQRLTKEAAGENDTSVTVGVASPGMLPAAFEPLLGRISLRLDHHSSATSFTDAELVDGGSASCAELVWDVLTLAGVTADRKIAEAVYVGLSTDTGCFRYANTTAHTFSVAAQCAQAEARIYILNQELFETNTLARLKMQAWIVDHMKLLQNGKMAIVAIPRALEEEIGVTQDDMDNISSFPRTVAGVCMAATLRQTKEGDTKLSVRAIPGYDATLITTQFGGGGHKGAAGASMKLPLEEAAAAVEQAMLALQEMVWTEL